MAAILFDSRPPSFGRAKRKGRYTCIVLFAISQCKNELIYKMADEPCPDICIHVYPSVAMITRMRVRYTVHGQTQTVPLFSINCPLIQNTWEGGVRVRGDAVLRCFWCGFPEKIFLTCGIAVFQDCAVCGNLKFYDAVNGEEMYLRCCILSKSHSDSL